MLNIVDLERRWLRYKIKSFLPYIIIGFSAIIIVVVLFIYLNHKDDSKIQKNEPVKQKVIEKQYTETVTAKPIKESKDVPIIYKHIDKKADIKPLTIKPSLNFINDIETNEKRVIKKEQIVKEPKKVKTPKKIKREKVVSPKIEEVIPAKEPIIEEPKKSDIVIQKKDTQNDIYEIIKRFKKNHNPALSLFVAKKYYEMGYYHQSYNYALVTNELNSEIEDSWIIFSKSLVKLGEKEKAIKILKRYIINSHSSNAQILLNDIRSGKFQ